VSRPVDLEEAYTLIHEDACAFETARDAVVVRGPDARSWLQGQLSQDLTGIVVGQSTETLVLSPQGKLDVYCRATVLAEEVILLDTATGYGELLSERLRRFRLRVKADLESGTVSCLEVRGPKAAARVAGLRPGPGSPAKDGQGLDDAWVMAVPVAWTGYAGMDVLKGAGAPAWEPGDLRLGDPCAFEAARIEAGVPAMGRELTGKTIPHEAGSLVEHTVSFTKGCFTGQELVARLESRGANVARRLRGVVVDPAGECSEDATLLSGERALGHLTSVAWSPRFSAPVALGYVRRDVVIPSEATLTPGGAHAEIREIPL
jgi:folate-binding protein YgfZ